MELRKRFYVALAIYAALGLAIWMTIPNVPLRVMRAADAWQGIQVTLRQLTMAIWALFVVRTVLHWRAEEIRGQREREKVAG
jgi:hypothetical protein